MSDLTIKNIDYNIKDLIFDFLFYDRKEDEDLPLGAIEKAIEDGNFTSEDIVNLFRKHLNEALSDDDLTGEML
jgi:hypothetical protein